MLGSGREERQTSAWRALLGLTGKYLWDPLRGMLREVFHQASLGEAAEIGRKRFPVRVGGGLGGT